jgi:hypothetical protein
MTEHGDLTTGSVRTTAAHPGVVHRQRQEGGSARRPGPSLRQPRRPMHATTDLRRIFRKCSSRDHLDKEGTDEWLGPTSRLDDQLGKHVRLPAPHGGRQSFRARL